MNKTASRCGWEPVSPELSYGHWKGQGQHGQGLGSWELGDLAPSWLWDGEGETASHGEEGERVDLLWTLPHLPRPSLPSASTPFSTGVFGCPQPWGCTDDPQGGQDLHWTLDFPRAVPGLTFLRPQPHPTGLALWNQ